MGASFRVAGLNEVRAELQKIDSKVRGEVMRESLTDAGEYVRKDVHDKCPIKGGTSVDGHYVSNAWNADPKKAGAVRKSVKWRMSPFGNAAVVYSNHILAVPLEKGTSRESPHPFFRRSKDDPNTKKKVKDIFLSKIREAIR